MNAPATAAALAVPKPTLEVLPLAAITPSGTHIQELRRARFDQKAMQELADSIKLMGVLQPIVVRPSGTAGKYELVAGERRWLATRLAGLTEIRASVCVLSPEQALEVQLVENLQREGLHELEEAEGYEELAKLKKINKDAVGDMIGKSRSYVYARIKLLALCPEARKAFYAGEIDASKALLVARIGHHDTQRKALLDVTHGEERWQGRRDDGPMSYREAHQHILKNYMLKLKAAPFDAADAALLPKAGACGPCPKRTGNQKELFGDVKDADVCTDPKCFDDKRQAHYAVARLALELKGEKVIHGEAAKKILPHWDSGNDRQLQGGYVPLEETSYASGRSRKVSEILGSDYKPVLIQHPGTGKIIKAATQQAVAAASQKGKSGSARSMSRPAKPKGPDINDQERDALVRLIHEKAPKVFAKPHLQVLARRLRSNLNVHSDHLASCSKAFGWPAGALSGGSHYSDNRLPAVALKLDVRQLTLLCFDMVFLADRYRRGPILDLFGISEKKVRDEILELRKGKAAAERLLKKKPIGSKQVSFMKPLTPKPALAAIIGAGAKLKLVFGGKAKVSMFDMTKLLSKQLTA